MTNVRPDVSNVLAFVRGAPLLVVYWAKVPLIAVFALTLTFWPLHSTFKPFAVSTSNDLCALSPACKDVRFVPPAGMFDTWQIAIEPAQGSSDRDRQALLDSIRAAAVRTDASVVMQLGNQTSKTGIKRQGA
jgi:hypothetical protein